MFHVFHNDILIGRSKLENGDPPMGCAEGQFAPFDEFTKFRKSVTPEQDNDVAKNVGPDCLSQKWMEL